MSNISKTPPTEFELERFHKAAKFGGVEIVREFLDRFGNQYIDHRSMYNSPALVNAAYNGHFDIVNLLLDRGANINAGTSSHGTPLFYAVWENRLEMATLLLQRGADMNVVNRAGKSALAHARKNNWHEIIDLFEKEPERRRLAAEAKRQARKDAMSVFTEGLKKDLRTRKLRLKLPRR